MRKNILHILVICAILTASFSSVFASVAQAQSTPNPDSVNIPGTHQDELGCSGEWQPDCANTQLTYELEDDVWQGTFEIQPNNDGDKKGPRYKAALNGGWGENYGLNASGGGADVPLLVSAPTQVKFYYDHKTHWITDSFNTPIVVGMGDFQQQLGCTNNDDAGCLRSWLEDPAGSGAMGFATRALKAGTYSVTFTLNEDPNNKIGETQEFTVKNDGDEIYFGYDTVKKETVISTEGAPKGSLSKLRAHWVSRDTILWNVVGSPKYTYSLYYSPDATLELSADGIQNGTEIPLTYSKSGAKAEIIDRFPHLGAYTALTVDEANWGAESEALKGQVAVLVRDGNSKVVDVSGVQIPGVLDDLYQYEGSLGVTFKSSKPTLRVWAPTAQAVTLNLFDAADAPSAKKLPMQLDPATGVWSISGDKNWKGKFYLYEVKVYVPSTSKIETNLVTDPYSFSLSMNSKLSQIVDLNDADLKPQGWDKIKKPTLAAPEDIVIYELHIRDFSISDQTVPENLRGTYKAFTVADSNGMKHLAELAKAGLTHIHLLPAFDIASVNEDKSTWQSVDEAQLSAYPPNSDQQSKAVSIITGTDGFNWGYDPLHYTTPEGSYATDPNGTTRIVEFRGMVQSLNQSGLRVVMDVVYNHTNASGQSDNSVLDRIVPGYYHRLNHEGGVEKSTCCANTATEHEMMRKLMVDSVVTWATEYKVDGFRFDLMGHHMLADMKAVRAALDSLTLKKDGVDGKSIYIYGEGWDFGEVANNTHGQNATQLNIAGTGIGVFNDRLRDAVRGGNPFDDVRLQGFSTGLVFADNANEKRTPKDQLDKLNSYSDWIRLGLAGNLADYEITRANGDLVPGNLVLYGKVPAGYTADPQENIVYASAHDNQTLFDAIQVKAPAEATLSDRISMNNLALSIVMFSQGVPFFHAGDDILRSKSLNPNSYNSGDWYNKLDWTYTSNNWGVGLPIEGTGQWSIYKPLLADPKLAPTQADIESASAVFRELLSIRKSSPLFRLQTADRIKQSVSFLNTGKDQVPGLIVMHLNNSSGLDANYRDIIVLFNSRPEAVTFTDASFSGMNYVLHPIQQNSADAITKTASFTANTFNVPPRTTAVFVIEEAKNESTSTNFGLSGTMIFTIIGAFVVIAGVAFFLMRRKS
ncbi:MAG: pullulanase-type alpha-1,6-glucosidase [Chloroflexi bacterium]|nr:pullulanase-type alpha-1,6-glucosidase [Chloroflexota bacterium]